jgi:hypothetical protein
MRLLNTIACAPHNASRHALERFLVGLVQLPRRLNCPDEPQPGDYCYDESTHTELRMIDWRCEDDDTDGGISGSGGCVALFDCHPFLGERVLASFGLTLLVIALLVCVVLLAERRATAARLAALRNKLR